MTILILSHPMDIHAVAVAEGLRRKEASVSLWHTADFPVLSGESVGIRQQGVQIKVSGPEISIKEDEIGAVWHRRPWTQPAKDILHPADRLFARQNCEAFRRSLFHLLAPGAFWVNPPTASDLSSQKIIQQYVAVQCGLSMPDTLYSNDPDEIRCFIAAQGGQVIFKILTGAPWRDDRTRWVSYSTPITTGQLVDDDILRQTPSIYQAIVPKEYELRVTFMGRQSFTARILSQETQEGKLDWRRAYSELAMEPAEIPEEIREHCLLLMERLGIVFGCFDFIVTPDGQYVFLEVNEMGQFLFVEEYTGLPLLDAFCDFLLTADNSFVYSWRDNPIRFKDLDARIQALTEEAAKTHVLCALADYYEGSDI